MVDATRFDGWTRRLARGQTTRRAAMAGLAAGLAGAALRTEATAQEATPVAEDQHPAFLFVQMAEEGSWTAHPDDPETFLLTLRGIGSQALFFSDRPERIVGTLPTGQFLESLGFTPDNPPNAAAVVRTPEGERDVLVVELFNPVYTRTFADGEPDTLQYQARVLEVYEGDGLADWHAEHDGEPLPDTFTDVSLFIDDCPDITTCNTPIAGRPGDYHSGGPIPGGSIGKCWQWDILACVACNEGAVADAKQRCNAGYSECQGNCCVSDCNVIGGQIL